jgi:putative transposase
VPQTISVDNGSEFISKVLDQWAYLNGVELDFSRPGKPTDKIEGWLDHYNTERPHGSLGDLSPKEFVLALSPAS